MATQEIARGVGSIHLKTVYVAAVDGREADVVEHRACVEKFGIKLETAPLTGKRAEIINATGVIEQQSGFRIADELRYFVGEFTVWNPDT
jgi:hypothetical protein